MNVQARPTLSAEEQARRRKLVDEAAWAARMEGLGMPDPAYAALDELWISGQITHEEHVKRAHAMLRARSKLV